MCVYCIAMYSVMYIYIYTVYIYMFIYIYIYIVPSYNIIQFHSFFLRYKLDHHQVSVCPGARHVRCRDLASECGLRRAFLCGVWRFGGSELHVWY